MADKNEEKRYKLWREIVKIDEKEESLDCETVVVNRTHDTLS